MRRDRTFEFLRVKGVCPNCARELRFATMEKACLVCAGMYLYDGEVRVGKAPPAAVRK
jgi:hypothetical protein